MIGVDTGKIPYQETEGGKCLDAQQGNQQTDGAVKEEYGKDGGYLRVQVHFPGKEGDRALQPVRYQEGDDKGREHGKSVFDDGKGNGQYDDEV